MPEAYSRSRFHTCASLEKNVFSCEHELGHNALAPRIAVNFTRVLPLPPEAARDAVRPGVQAGGGMVGNCKQEPQRRRAEGRRGPAAVGRQLEGTGCDALRPFKL